jgi:hypothetical protein
MPDRAMQWSDSLKLHAAFLLNGLEASKSARKEHRHNRYEQMYVMSALIGAYGFLMIEDHDGVQDAELICLDKH